MNKPATNLRTRIESLLQTLNTGLHEREEILAVALLAALSDQSVFLFGPPGTAKSLIARRLSCAFKDSTYFESLMQKFSTPEELFGPVSITELKKDNYKRKIEGYLPDADFAFLDEIWKSSPAILNTLLTVINERIFRNGSEAVKVPLKALISASNETPPPHQGLEALYDRFIVRLTVPPLQERSAFEKLLQASSTPAVIPVPESVVITSEEWSRWKAELQKVTLSPETLHVIQGIRAELEVFNKKKANETVYVSDRRWQKAASLIKASAYLCGRMHTNLADTLLLRHCLWTHAQNKNQVMDIVEQAIKDHGITVAGDLQELDFAKDKLDKDIQKSLFHTKDIYQTVELGSKPHFEINLEVQNFYGSLKSMTIYIPQSEMKTNANAYPVDEEGDEISSLRYNFKGQTSCLIELEPHRMQGHGLERESWERQSTFSPTVQIPKGAQKEAVDKRLVEAFKKEGEDLKESFEMIHMETEDFQGLQEKAIETPFVPAPTRGLILEGIEEHIQEISLRIVDCDAILAKLQPFQ